ncbi:MAG TPA: DUF2723 domain-containing protein [Polyangiaceae bacterium]|nr:DUF2723 domain-containing protein [Polyangiaceae bacterium]
MPAADASLAPKRVDVRLVALAVGAAAAILFGLTAHWDAGGRVNPGDSAKFQYLPMVNGTPHSTGYPTYLMIGKLLYWALPFLTASVRATAFSVLCGASAVAVVFLWCVTCTDAVLASVAAAALVATGANYWLASTDAEVYALHLLYFSTVLLFATRALNGIGKAPLRTALLLYALSFGNHLTMIALGPALAWLVLTLEGRRLWRPRTLAVGAALVLLAVSQYAYIYYLSHWGGGRQLEYVRADVSLKRLFDYVTGQQFKDRFFVFSLRQIITERSIDAALVIRDQLSLAGVACALLGVFRSLVRPISGRFLPLVLLTIAGQLFIALNYRIEGGLYLTPIALLLAPFIALGLGYFRRAALLAPVAAGLVLFHAQHSFSSSLLHVTTNPVARLRWQSAQATGCRSLITAPNKYTFNLLRKYLQYTGEYVHATPITDVYDVDTLDGLCVDRASKKVLEPLGFHFQPQPDSLADFFARNREHTLLIALSSDAPLAPETRRAFESLGLAASKLGAGGAYVGVVHHGRPVAEQLSKGRPVKLQLPEGQALEGFVPPKNIQLRAAGPRSGGNSAILLANTERAPIRNGVRIVVLDDDWNILGDIKFRAAGLEQFSLYFASSNGAPTDAPAR